MTKRFAFAASIALLSAALAAAQTSGTSTSPTTSPSATKPQVTTPAPASPSTTPQAKPQTTTPAASPAPAQPAPSAKPQLTKDETVFAVLDPSGAVKSVIVSDWIHSDKANVEIKDKSNLTNIENVKGYEQPRRVGDSLMWKLDGNDLYYRGKSSQNLPLSVNIRYWLDGKPIEPKDISGKTGTIRVRVELKNLAASDRIIDGTKRRIYAPMVVVVGVILPISGYREIQVPNGLMLTDGQSNIVAGLLVPGLKESIAAAGGFGSQGIDLSSFGIKDLPLPDAFEFTAKAERFKLGSIYIAATPDFPEIGGPNSVKVLDDALLGFSQLSDASKAIADGSSQLAQGTATLRVAVSQALSTVRPLLADLEPALGKVTDILNDEASIAAARELFSSGDALTSGLPVLSKAVGAIATSENQARIKSIADTAQKINIKDIVGIPGAASLLSEDSLAAIASFLVAGDDLYKGMDESRLQAAANFAANSTVLFDAISAYDELLKSYDVAAGATLQAFGAKAADYDAAAKNLARYQSQDAAKAAAGLQERAKADASFVGATAFLDDQAAVAALTQKLASGAALTEAESANLAKLLAASSAQRTAVKATGVQQVAEALPALDAAARLAAGASQAAQAAATVSKVIPGLQSAQALRTKNDQAIAAARKILDPKMTNVITSTVPKVFAARKAYDKNKGILQAARSFLQVRMQQGSFKSQIDAIDAIQKDLKALEPAITTLQTALADPALAKLVGYGNSEPGTPDIADFLADFEQLKPLLTMGSDLLSNESILKLRSILAKFPDIEAALNEFDDGSALLAVKMSELAAGTKQFNDQGMQAIASQIIDKAQMLRGFLKVKDELAALSRDYQSFSGAPEGADTTLKFIFKTDEIR